jgi:hypothetical protein
MVERSWSDRVGDFVQRWYEHPIGEQDGNSDDELRQAEETLGLHLPAALAHWYQLVGRRLRSTQDSPVLLHEIAEWRTTPRSFPVWIENQSVWTIEAPVGSDDPEVTLKPPQDEWLGGPLSEILLAMLMSDTLVGVWSCSGQGALGSLKGNVVGGYLQGSREEVDDRVRASLPALGVPTNPFFEEPWRGHDDLVLRYNGDGWEWMVCNDDALGQACALLDIDPNAGPFEVVVCLSALSDREFRLAGGNDNKAQIERLSARVGIRGHVGHAFSSPRQGVLQVHVTTSDPDAVFREVRHAFPSEFDTKLVIACRPESIARFHVLYPAGLTRWWPPG